MSKQNKAAGKRRAGHFKSGPAKTEPKHGKVNRWPYDAKHQKRRAGR